MLLVIDSGNTNSVLALYRDDVLCGRWRIANDPNRTADEYAAWLTRLMDLNGLDFHAVRDAVIASVVPATQKALIRFCQDYLKCTPLIIAAQNAPDADGIDFGFALNIDTPMEVGPDRLANVAAVNDAFATPAIVIDFGTATTFDVINRKGDYCGGAIAPGIELSIQALHAAAARLPLIGVEKPETAIGTSTITAMQSGIYWGYVGMVDSLVTRLSQDLGEGSPTLVATGGLAESFCDATQSRVQINPDLTLRGLLCLYHRNRTQ